MFPQVSADLSVRWCSAYLKIDVASVAINNDPALRDLKICYVSGERREESSARAKYAEVEEHRTSNKRRRVDHWRNVIDYSEAEVWALIERHGVVPHPAYYLGWGRVSCLACIFGNADQWASVRAVAPERFARVAGYEAEFGKTIKRGKGVTELADGGVPYPGTLDVEMVKLAMGEAYDRQVLTDEWKMPAGAFTRSPGPT
jgi:3'-phosphoadenosine 5'-phosphosulfate sulfotransferase (PAPS reductase)/FAD synthetase